MVAPPGLPRSRARRSSRRSPSPAARPSRVIAAFVAAVLSMGGIPGTSFRPVAYDFPLPPAAADDQRRDASVLVTVRDGPGGATLAGARVSAFSLIGDLAYLGAVRETDPSGSALLAMLPRGAMWIIAEAPGRARASTRIVADAERRSVTLELEPAHAVDVVVKDESGAPIAWAEVEVVALSDSLPVGARTASDGVAHVSRLGGGPWRATARAPGYEAAGGRASHDGDVVRMVLRRLGSFAVHVTDEADRPIEGAHVAVAGAMLWPARVAETDAQGDVRIHGLAAGSYALRASRGDLVSRIELGVVLLRGEEKPVLLRVAPGHWVAVRVIDGDENDARGVPAARVTLAEAGLSPFPLEATTDAKGGARLGPIAAGASLLSVRADGFVARAVPVADPPPPQTLVALVRAGVLTGRVVDDRGYPIDGATIEIVGTDPLGAPIFDDPRRASFQAAHFDAMLAGPAPLVPAGQLGVVPGPVPPIPQFGNFSFAGDMGRTLPAREVNDPWVTRSDGSFRAAPASPGRVRAIVRHPQYVEAESDLVTLAPGEEAHVDVVMHGGGALEGRVVDSHDRPVEGARVIISAARGTLERTTRTASDGTFGFAALPDTVSLTASVDNREDQPDVRLMIAIPEHERKDVTIRLPDPRRALAVAVVDDRDFPIAAAQLSAASLAVDVPLRATAFTDAHGDASLNRASGLPLRIEASAPGHAPRVVTTDGTSEGLRIELAPAESATGEVFASRGGEAVAGAEVTFYSDLGVRHARTDARGAFDLRELAPGGASLRVRAPRFASFSRSVAIPDSAGRHPFALPRIELTAAGLVEGEVVDGRGDPVAGARVAKDHAPTWLVIGGDTEGVAVTNAKGHFSLGELPEGTVVLEAFAPDLGRGHLEGVRIVAGRTTPSARIVLARTPADEKPPGTPEASGSVAVTLGETSAPVQVVVVSVASGSEAERAGIAPGDIILAVDESPVVSMIDARDKLGGALSDDVVVRIRRGEREVAMRVAREAVHR